MESYWEIIEPLFGEIDTGRGAEELADSISRLRRPAILLYCAHMALAEVYNGDLLQLFWNSTGIVVPEAIEGFNCIGLPRMAEILTEAASLLGQPYPRDRDSRWDAMLVASGRNHQELRMIFDGEDNLYIAFAKATSSLPFGRLDGELLDCARTENGGFQAGATRFANLTSIGQ